MMSDPERKKRPPEKMGPRGAKDAIRFRERLDALSWRSTHAGTHIEARSNVCEAANVGSRVPLRCAKRTARIHAGGERSVVRRRSLRLSRCGPIQLI